MSILDQRWWPACSLSREMSFSTDSSVTMLVCQKVSFQNLCSGICVSSLLLVSSQLLVVFYCWIFRTCILGLCICVPEISICILEFVFRVLHCWIFPYLYSGNLYLFRKFAYVLWNLCFQFAFCIFPTVGVSGSGWQATAVNTETSQRLLRSSSIIAILSSISAQNDQWSYKMVKSCWLAELTS